MEGEAAKTEHGAPKSTSELMASAKTVAEAAQFACTQQTDKIDKAKVAGAAEDVLEATKSYGKLDENSGVGQYVTKAEGYLHNLHASSDSPSEAAGKDKEKEPSAAAEKEPSSGGGGGGLMGMAKGLFNK
uniref:Salinity-induced protein n=1 Tax=Salicornia brachiata TaxID=179119 RepID=T1YW73_9CARY|nr:salinity-induced protein [Salicornia brachiata]